MTSEEMRPEAVDRAHELLSDSRRRYLLYRLLDIDRANVDEVSRELAAREQDVPAGAVSEAERERVAVSLVHNHLPRLVDHDVLEYDAQSGDILPAAGFDEFRSFIQHANSVERDARRVATASRSQTNDLPD